MDSYQQWDLGIKAAIGVVTVGLGIGAWVIAYRQSNTARDKLKLDLYEKRFDVQRRVTELIDKAYSEYVPEDKLNEMFRELSPLRFLFREDVVTWYRQVQVVVERMNHCHSIGHTTNQEYEDHLRDEYGPPREFVATFTAEEQVQANRDLVSAQKELNELTRRFDALFLPYLDFRKNL